MHFRILVAGLLFNSVVTSFEAKAADDWHGYLNDKLLSGEKYGFLSSISDTSPVNKLRLVCHSNGLFTLSVDAALFTEATALIKNTVDKLPSVYLTARRVNGSYDIYNDSPEFWKLIAQMSAGIKLNIDSGAGSLHQHGLSGFTYSFLDVCGWSDDAKQFQQYIDRYR